MMMMIREQDDNLPWMMESRIDTLDDGEQEDVNIPWLMASRMMITYPG